MNVQVAEPADFDYWIALAGEVEYLFGPMVEEPAFRTVLRQVLTTGEAFCVRWQDGGPGAPLHGGIVIDADNNLIEWFAVSEVSRGRGVGRALLEYALGRLDPDLDVRVQTFADTVPEGVAARRLYQSLGFEDVRAADPTPAGVATVVMARPAVRAGEQV